MIKFNKKMLSLFVAGNMVLSHISFAYAEIITQGDKVKATTVVNIRDNNSLDGEKIGQLKKIILLKEFFLARMDGIYWNTMEK